jgi:hypothetical protein
MNRFRMHHTRTIALTFAVILTAASIPAAGSRPAPNLMPTDLIIPYPPNARCGLWLANGRDWNGWTLGGLQVTLAGLALQISPSDQVPSLISSSSGPILLLQGSTDAIGAGSSDSSSTPGATANAVPQDPPPPSERGTGPGRSAPEAQGSATGPPIETHYPFTNLVASWNADTPAGSVVETEVRVRMAGRWSRWFAMGRWSGPGSGASIPNQETPDARVDVDTLILHEPATACQFRAFLASRSDAPPSLKLAAMSWFNPAAPDPPPPPVAGDWARTLNAPCYSQREQDPRIAGEICSPTSLSMVLSYWGIPCQPMDAVAGVHDTAADMYGNWPLNTAYAASRGCAAYVARFWSVEQLQNEIARGCPVEASIRFKKGELDGAPLHASSGHLVVVVGFTPSGDVVVNDPYGPNAAGVRHIYRRDQFARVWLEGSGGIVYLVHPRAGAPAPTDLTDRPID